MRAKILIACCTALAVVFSLYAKASRNLATLDDSWHCAGAADLTLEEWKHPSAETLGRMLRICAGPRTSITEARKLAADCARKKHQDERWIENFMRGFSSENIKVRSQRP